MVRESLHRRLIAGEVLFHEGDLGDCAYVVESGQLEVSIERDGRQHVLASVGPGALVGEMALLDHGPRSATVTALEVTQLQRLDPGHLDRRLDGTDPLVAHMLRVVLARYRDLVERVVALRRPERAGAGPGAAPEHGTAGHRHRMRHELHEAVDKSEFVLHYQPIMRLSDQTVAGFEALIRWLHPERGLIAPDHFIPAAEESGAIVRMGHWIIRTAAAALAQLDNAGPCDRARHPLFMTVNLSSRQFEDPELIDVLRDALVENAIEPGRLRLEITESSLFNRLDVAADFMEQCSELGVTLAVDDFGTGYSALSYLYRLPVSGVKLARAFVRDLAEYPQSVKIVGAVSKLAKELDMHTIAEGIEQAHQAASARSLGIEYGQGYFYAAALPLMIASGFMQRAQQSSLMRAPLAKFA